MRSVTRDTVSSVFWLRREPGYRRMAGTPPRGDLERKVQKWIDENKGAEE